MALILMPVWDTPENNRSWMTCKTIEGLHCEIAPTKRHRLIVVNNGSCPKTVKNLNDYSRLFPRTSVIHNDTNRGVAYACNQALALRQPGEIVIKMDNDCIVSRPGWVDDLCACIEREPKIGILGLKRNDMPNWPLLPISDGNRSRIVPLPKRDQNERWLAVEHVPFQVSKPFMTIVGTCVALNPLMLDKIGYFWHQSKSHGQEDSIYCARCEAAGFMACYYPWIEIDHIDPMADDDYLKWKMRLAAETGQETMRLMCDIITGKRGYYFDFER